MSQHPLTRREPPRQVFDERSHIADVCAPATQETLRFLQDVCFQVPYRDFLTLKFKTFERIRALAMSDEFEEVTDEAKSAILGLMVPIEDLRSYPEYEAIRLRLRTAAAEWGSDGEGRKWLEETATKVARTAIIRGLREGVGGENREATKVALEVMERDIPKLSRNQGDKKVVHVPDDLRELLEQALKIANSREEETEDGEEQEG